MAKIEIVTLMDSLDERVKSGVETVTFYDPSTGTKREIELGEANRKHFAGHLAKLAKYIEASRAVEGAKQKFVKAQGNSDLAKVREWAKQNGYAVGDRGRIKAEITDAYYAAQNAQIPTQTVTAEAQELAEQIAAEIESAKVVDEVVEGSQEVANGTDDAWQGDGPTDAEILAMMTEIEQTKGEVSLKDLASALDSKLDDN
jgi:nucleoid-associated protein Lsr2